MAQIRLHDTRSGRLRELEPHQGKIGVYACGPTVYNRIHIGNARPFVVFSQLKRFLEHEGLPTTLVINVTDVNDKIYDAARPAGIPSARLAQEMTAHYVADTDALGLGRPDHEPLASETIGPIVDLIARLIDEGAAYAVDGDVYFAVRQDPEYGSLSHRSIDDMDQGEGVEGTERKRDPLDFALWKAQKEGEDTAWDAPWGRGRPGWHIECSAMAEELLGLEFAVHGGGSDLVFPHHENEAAQTRRARGRELAQIWMHNGMLEARGGEKMAKSVGNITPLNEAVAQWGRDALVLYFAGAHYRQPIVWSEDALRQAQAGVKRLREAGRRVDREASSPADLAPLRDAFFAALADDFNTPRALVPLWEWVGEANKREAPVGGSHLAEMLGVLGLENLLEAEEGPPGEIVELAERRQAARADRDFAESDRLRDEIRAGGWEVRDTADGYELAPAP
jgi:cysteinyl-tRNA synthetase